VLGAIALWSAAACVRAPGTAAALPPGRTTPSDLAGPEAMDEADLRMRRLGFEPAGEPEHAWTRPGNRLFLTRRIAAGDCAVFGALGSEDGDTLALRLRQGGELLAADPTGRPAAWVAHCAESDVDVQLELDVLAGGDREITVVAFRASRSAVPEWAGPALRVAAKPRDPAAVESAISRRLDSAGYEQGRVLLEAEAALTGDRRRFLVELATGQCGILVAAAGAGVGGLVVEAHPANAPLSRAVGDNRRPALMSLCSADGGSTAVEMAVIAGAGPVRATFHPLPEIPLPPALADPPLAIREAAALFARHGMAAAAYLEAPAPLPEGGWSAPFVAEPGSCFGFAAARRDAIPIETFRLAEATGRELGRWTGPAAPALLARCVHGAPADLVLGIVESGEAGDAARKPPVIVVFVSEALAATPFLDGR
jgi:hypothetical protein